MGCLRKVISIVFVVMVAVGSSFATTIEWKKTTIQKKTTVVRTYPRVGSTVKVINTNSVKIVHNKKNYRYVNGVFYKTSKVGFIVVNPPIGIVVRTLPKTVVVVRHRGRKYYKVNNFYFVLRGGKYTCVRSPF